MKKSFFTLAISLIATTGFAQWNQNGNSSTSGNLSIGNYQKDNGELTIRSGNPQISRSYLNFDFGKTKSGLRSAKLEDLSTTLAFFTSNLDGTLQDRIYIKGNGNVGIGTADPQYVLDVNGKFYLRAVDNTSYGWLNSYFYYPGHLLTIGSPKGYYAHNAIEFKPGGASQGLLHSSLSLFLVPKIDDYQKKVQIHTYGNSYFNGGNVGIGTDNPKNLLDVNGTIRAKEIKVELENWSDFVFNKDYNLPSLQEVEAHINEYKHLPGVPSEKQVKEEGVNLAEMQAKLLQKIEELTLYVIELKKENNEIKRQLNNLNH